MAYGKKIAPEDANYIKMLSVVIFVSAPLLWLSDDHEVSYKVKDTQTSWILIQEFEMSRGHPFSLATFPLGFVRQIFNIFKLDTPRV